MQENRPVLDALCDRLARADAVLALDNCEHLVEACAVLVERVLSSAPGLRVVTTSREPLGVPGEVLWRVPPLDDAAAAQLFVERAANVRPGFVPDAAAAGAIAGICRRLDGIPLAIELAAARVRMMAPERIEAALDDRFRLLTGCRPPPPSASPRCGSGCRRSRRPACSPVSAASWAPGCS